MAVVLLVEKVVEIEEEAGAVDHPARQAAVADVAKLEVASALVVEIVRIAKVHR